MNSPGVAEDVSKIGVERAQTVTLAADLDVDVGWRGIRERVAGWHVDHLHLAVASVNAAGSSDSL